MAVDDDDAPPMPGKETGVPHANAAKSGTTDSDMAHAGRTNADMTGEPASAHMHTAMHPAPLGVRRR